MKPTDIVDQRWKRLLWDKQLGIRKGSRREEEDLITKIKGRSQEASRRKNLCMDFTRVRELVAAGILPLVQWTVSSKWLKDRKSLVIFFFFFSNLQWVYPNKFIWSKISSYDHCIFESQHFILNWPPRVCSGPCSSPCLTKLLWWYQVKILIRMSSTLSYLQLPFLMLLVIPWSSRGFYFMLLGLEKAVVGSEVLSFPISSLSLLQWGLSPDVYITTTSPASHITGKKVSHRSANCK